jgi:hypothetical protein
MNIMNMPGFTADQSLYAVRGRYRSGRFVAGGSNAVIPAIPRCENCDWILDNCERNGWRPRALCAACAAGNCDSSEENPGGRCWYDPISGRRICDL